MKKLDLNLKLFYVYSIFQNSVFARGIFVLFLLSKGFDNATVGLLQAILYWSIFVSEVPTGIFGDRWGRKISVVIGFLILAINGFAQVCFDELLPFVVIFIFQGVAFSFVSGSDSAILYDTLVKLKRSEEYIKINSRIRFVGSTTFALAMAMGGWMKNISWELVYYSYSIAMILAMLTMFMMVEPKVKSSAEVDEVGKSPQEEAGIYQALKEFFHSEKGKRLIPLMLSSAFFHSAVTPYFIFSQNLFQSIGLMTPSVSMILAATQVGAAITGLMAPRIKEKLSMKTVMYICLAVLSVSLMVQNFMIVPLSIVSFFCGHCFAEVFEIYVIDYYQSQIPSKIRASSLSTLSLLETGMIGVAYILIGKIMDSFSPAMGIVSLAIFPLLSALFFWIYTLSKRTHSHLSISSATFK